MSLSSINKRLGKHQFTPKAVQEKRSIDDHAYPCMKTLSITDIPDDFLGLVYQRIESLKSKTDISSFGLVCRHWLHIQNNNHMSLWGNDEWHMRGDYNLKCNLRKSPSISPENFSIIFCKLLIRFKHLKRLFLSGLPEVKDYITSQSQLFGSKVQFLCLRRCSNCSDKYMSLVFSCFPHLTSIRLSGSNINDKGLQILEKSCASLEEVDLSNCQGITDLEISFLIQNCSKLHSIRISSCNDVTGIGFLGCPKTLTDVSAVRVRKLTTEGIKAIASGGGIRNLCLSGNAVNDEAVIIISKGCPLLKSLFLDSCHEVQLQGWEAIGMYGRNLENLFLGDCPKLCDQGMKALCYGCKKLSRLYTDSDSVREIFKRERPDVYLLI